MTDIAAITLRGDIVAWGLILDMLDPIDPMPLWEQIHANYAHGGGWHDFEGFEVAQGDADGTEYVIKYAGDPAYTEVSRIQRGNEQLVLFHHSWVLWTNGTEHDNVTKIARID